MVPLLSFLSMPNVGWKLIAVVAIVAAWLVIGRRAHAGRVPCDEVIRRIIHDVSAERGKSADISHVARQLHTDIPWVEHCMQAAGRRPKRPGLEAAESREERLEAYESDEPEEAGAEDKQEPGAKERLEHPARERQQKIHIPVPTPDYYHNAEDR